MLRSSLAAIALVSALAMAAPASSEAQTLLPDARSLIGGSGDESPGRGCLPGASLLCVAETVASGAGDAVGGFVGAGAGVAADAVMDGIVGWAANGASWLVKAVARQIDRSTRPALGSAWFSRQYAAMRDVALSLSIVFLLAAILQAAVRRDLSMLARSCLVALPLAFLLTFAAVTLVELGVALTDALTAAALQRSGGQAQEAFSDVAAAFDVDVPGTNPLPGLVLFLGALLTALLALVVWIELVLREAAIYVAVAFLPIALVAFVWPRTAHWAQRLGEWLVAIILAKFGIATSFAVAGSMLADGRPGTGGLSAMLAGFAVLLVAALSPWVILRLIPFVEQGAASLQRGHVRGAVRTAPGAAATSLLVRQAMLKNLGAGMSSARRPQAWAPRPLKAQSPVSKKSAR